MNEASRQKEKAQGHGEDFARTAQYEWLARGGLLARGIVYAIIGFLAVKVALPDSGGSKTDQQGALKEIAQQPFGKALLAAMALGLAGYAIWRLVRAGIGHGKEDGDDGALERIGGVVSGISYVILCVTAIQILIGSGGGSGGASQQTGGVLGWTGGVWIVGLAGAFTIGAGLEDGYKALKKKFLEKAKTDQMSPGVERWYTRIGIAGHLARMVVVVLIGYFLIKAAIEFDPKQAASLDGALAEVGQASYGKFLLGLVAAGLLTFGVFSMLDSRYRKI